MGSAMDKPSDLDSSSSSLNTSQWATVIERTTPLENSKGLPKDDSNVKEDEDKSKDEVTPNRLIRPTLNARLITAEEVLACEGPESWSRLTEFMRTREISRPERSRSEPARNDAKRSSNQTNLPAKKRLRQDQTPE